MGLELTAAKQLSLGIDRDQEAPPIEPHRVDPDLVDKVSDCRGLLFAGTAEGEGRQVSQAPPRPQGS